MRVGDKVTKDRLYAEKWRMVGDNLMSEIYESNGKRLFYDPLRKEVTRIEMHKKSKGKR